MNSVMNSGNFKQDIHPTARIAQGAVIVGNVTIEEDRSIWYNAVIEGMLGQSVIWREWKREYNISRC